MDEERVAALERIARGAVAVTTRALTDAAPGEDVTFPQWRVLLLLGEEPDGMRLSEVARRVGVTQPATSRLLDRLAHRGLVAFADDPLDRRATRAGLTVAGRDVRGAILAHRQEALRGIAEAVGRARTRSGPEAPAPLDVLLEALAAEFDRVS